MALLGHDSRMHARLLACGLRGHLTRTMPMPAMRRTAAASARPRLTNIVLAMSDDQGWAEVGYRYPQGPNATRVMSSGACASCLLPTPNLVEMAASGLRFERFYANPICSPTRASVLTGRSAESTRVVHQGVPMSLHIGTVLILNLEYLIIYLR